MKELTLKRRLNTYFYMWYPGISSNFENGTKQLEAQLENYKKIIKKNMCNRLCALDKVPPQARSTFSAKTRIADLSEYVGKCRKMSEIVGNC